MRPNGAADKPRRAGKTQALPPGVGLIRVVVRRFAPSNHADAYPPPRCRGREASATTPAFSAPRHPTKLENTRPLRGAGALERFVRQVYQVKMSGNDRAVARPRLMHFQSEVPGEFRAAHQDRKLVSSIQSIAEVQGHLARHLLVPVQA